MKKAIRIRNISDKKRKQSFTKTPRSVSIDTGKLNKQAMLTKMTKIVEAKLNKDMASEQELQNKNQLQKNFNH